MNSSTPGFKVVTYTAPASWASYLFNGDASSLEDWEQLEIDAMIADIGLGAPTGIDGHGYEWRSTPDYGMPGHCERYQFIDRSES